MVDLGPAATTPSFSSVPSMFNPSNTLATAAVLPPGETVATTKWPGHGQIGKADDDIQHVNARPGQLSDDIADMLARLADLLVGQLREFRNLAGEVIYVDRFEIDANHGERLLVEEGRDGLGRTARPSRGPSAKLKGKIRADCQA